MLDLLVPFIIDCNLFVLVVPQIPLVAFDRLLQPKQDVEDLVNIQLLLLLFPLLLQLELEVLVPLGQ